MWYVLSFCAGAAVGAAVGGALCWILAWRISDVEREWRDLELFELRYVNKCLEQLMGQENTNEEKSS